VIGIERRAFSRLVLSEGILPMLEPLGSVIIA
jgi:hypothetical protein